MTKRKFDVANIANTSKKQKNNTDINLEEDVIKYYLMPSLQHISISNIIITLWNQADIKYQIVKLFNEYEDNFYTDMYELFLKIEDKVLGKLSPLAVPSGIRKILSNIIHPIGHEIFGWIMYQDKYIFNNGYYGYQNLKPIAINYIDDLVWTPRGVIDYKETAKTLLAKEEKLSDGYKYNMACAYCFEDNIAIIASKVIGTTLVLNSIERQAMVYFWTAHITGDFTELDKAVYSYNRKYSTNYSTNECLFTVLIDNRTNQIAIKYIWDKLSNEEKSRQIVPAIKKTSNTDIKCFLLSQMSKEQEKEVFKTYDASKILLCFLDDWLWGQYFLPTIHHIWDIMSGCDYLRVLQNIVNKMEKNHEDIEKYNQYKATFKELWQCAPKHLKEYVFEHENGYSCSSIFFSLFCKENIDIIQSILFDSNDIQKKKIIFSNYGIGICHFFITSNQWDLLEMFIGSTLFSREDVECFKQIVIKEKGQDIAVRFIQNKEWNKVEQFLQWALKSDDDIREFKLKLAYSKICDDILESIVTNNKADFTELEYFFKWCASGNVEGVIELKIEIPQLYFDEIISKLIEEDKYELLEQILNWCFINDLKQIVQLKQSCYQDDQIYKIVELIVNLIKQDDQLQSLKKFVYYWCSTDEEINKFKTCILHPTEDTVGVCMELLCENMFKLADEFVSWCCNSSQIQIDNFKNQLMTDDGMVYLSEGDDPRTFYETEVIRWFNPSIETIIRFKEKFINSWWLKDILPVLDNYVQEQKDNQGKAINKDINTILYPLLSAVENQDNNIINGNDHLTVSPTGIITEDTSVIL
ncbi:hypothetical protein [Candidatus Tisiphia endosymbiont of Metellina segmentata]|uniref:hypothetical protein n=1 Tax=Candidatus Tisiphia endosymbiont of Metellina segmentata TaxID=3066274 RepID=UPI00313E5E05